MNKNKGRWPYTSLCISLALAVLASFVLACDPPNTPTDPPPVGPGTPVGPSTPAGDPVVKLSPKVVGMREMLITTQVTDMKGAANATVVFIVSESSQAPAWDAVKNNKARFTRKFLGEEELRDVYMSVTNRYASSPGVVDLATASNHEDEVALTRERAPGILVPGEKYFVHAYNAAGGTELTSLEVTTENYPNDTPKTRMSSQMRPLALNLLVNLFLSKTWLSNAWSRDSNTLGTKETADSWASLYMFDKRGVLEVKAGEIYFLTNAILRPATNLCVTNFEGELRLRGSATGTANLDPFFIMTSNNGAVRGGSFDGGADKDYFSFVNSPALRDQLGATDVLWDGGVDVAAIPATAGSDVFVDVNIPCRDGDFERLLYPGPGYISLILSPISR